MKISRVTLHVAFCVLLMFGFAGRAVAATTTKSSTKSTKSTTSSDDQATSQLPTSATGIQTYTAASSLQIGTIVQLAGGKTTANSVVAATSAKMQEMYGVVVDPNILPLTVTDSNLTNETYVGTTGRYNVLVDTENGPIETGDFVTMSAIDGVAMKAGTYEQQGTVFGRATADFDGKTNVIGTTTLKETNAATSSETVQVGEIPVAIDIERNPNQISTKVDLPPFLTQLGQAVAQKPIGPTRIYLSLLITGLSIVVALVTLYSGIRSALIAIGRNPLSKKSIFRGLLEVIITGFLILIIGLFAVYLLLKL